MNVLDQRLAVVCEAKSTLGTQMFELNCLRERFRRAQLARNVSRRQRLQKKLRVKRFQSVFQRGGISLA